MMEAFHRGHRIADRSTESEWRQHFWRLLAMDLSSGRPQALTYQVRPSQKYREGASATFSRSRHPLDDFFQCDTKTFVAALAGSLRVHLLQDRARSSGDIQTKVDFVFAKRTYCRFEKV